MTTPAADTLAPLLSGLWRSTTDERLRAILPHDVKSLGHFYSRLQEYVHSAPRAVEGTIDPAAIVRGEIVSMGRGSTIEPGAIIQESCRLILGAGSRVRSGAVLRDEVVVGDDCLIGVHCEVVRSVILGPGTALGHNVFLGDSIVGSRALLSAYLAFANVPIRSGGGVMMRLNDQKVDTGRTKLGALVGDDVRIGSSTTVCPGTVIAPGLVFPPGQVLIGYVDQHRRDRLVSRFFERWEG